MPSEITMGELLSRRKLRKQEDPVKRYIPGQFRALLLSQDDALVSYVDTDGGLCILPVWWSEEGGQWQHRQVIVRCTFKTAEVRYRPQGGHLAAEIVNALTKAREAKGRQNTKS